MVLSTQSKAKMATLTTALNTVFTPAAGNFAVQVSGGAAVLQRRQTSDAAWVNVGAINATQAMIVDSPVAGMQYQFVVNEGTPVVQADQ